MDNPISLKVSIIIITFNNLELTKLCIDSIITKTDYQPYEIIVIDNNSNDGTKEYLTDLQNCSSFIKIILNNENRGFAKANNQGIKAANGDYIVFLNNDTVVTRGWLTKLVEYLYKYPDIGLVGPVTNSIWNEARVFLEYDSLDEMEVAAAEYVLGKQGSFFDIDMLALFCAATRKDVIDKVGLLDEQFGVGMFEDDDYCHRVKLAGYRVVCVEDVFIHHFGSASFNELAKTGEYGNIFERNKRIFEQKWNISWKRNWYPERMISFEKRIKELKVDKEKIWAGLKQSVSENESLRYRLAQSVQEKDAIMNQLNRIYESDFWRVVSHYYKLRDKLLFKYPHKLFSAYRREGAESIIKKIYRKIRLESASLEQRDPSNPYENLKLLKDINITVLDKDYAARNIKTPFSLVTTIKNESDNIVSFLKSIEEQSLIPGEVIIVDGGSTDNTVNLIEDYMEKSVLKMKLIKHHGINIAGGRNIGIKEAQNEILVLTDAGCRIDKSFCSNLVGCFAEYCNDADLVGGIYQPLQLSEFSKYFIYDWENVDWQYFLPSARSVAVRKSIAVQINGFPEFLTLTGEDTLFDINYRRVSRKWIFNKKAFVYWAAPKTQEQASRLAISYGRGDGESGIGDFRFYDTLKEFKATKANGEEIINRMFEGFIEGRQRRSLIEIERRRIKGLVLILATEAITDPAGNRGAQLVSNLIEKGYKVIYVNVNSSRIDAKHHMNIDYTLLELYHFYDFDIEELINRYDPIMNSFTIIVIKPNAIFEEIISKVKNKVCQAKILNFNGAMDISQEF